MYTVVGPARIAKLRAEAEDILLHTQEPLSWKQIHERLEDGRMSSPTVHAKLKEWASAPDAQPRLREVHLATMDFYWIVDDPKPEEQAQLEVVKSDLEKAVKDHQDLVKQSKALSEELSSLRQRPTDDDILEDIEDIKQADVDLVCELEEPSKHGPLEDRDVAVEVYQEALLLREDLEHSSAHAELLRGVYASLLEECGPVDHHAWREARIGEDENDVCVARALDKFLPEDLSSL